MRTKTLLLTAALGAAGVASAIAQVYSVNAVGYVNKTLVAGFNLVSNPLNTGNNTLAEVIPTIPDDTVAYTFGCTGGFAVRTYDSQAQQPGWQPNGTLAVPPGTGLFLRVAAPITVTFVGEVPQGDLKVPLCAQYNLVGSPVPQAGKITTDLKFTPSEGDSVLSFAPASGYTLYTYEMNDAGVLFWNPTEPSFAVADGFWIRKGVAGEWARQFSVNP
jgi:hypothetical protein